MCESGLTSHSLIRWEIWSRTLRNFASFASSSPTNAAGSSNGQCSVRLANGQIFGHPCCDGSHTMIANLTITLATNSVVGFERILSVGSPISPSVRVVRGWIPAG